MFRVAKSPKGGKQSVHERWAVLPLLNLSLEVYIFATLQIKCQQTTRHQIEQAGGCIGGLRGGLGVSIFTDPRAALAARW